MKIECDVIRDLLPLYVEDMASDGSRKLIEEHIQTCERCKQVLAQMQSAVSVPVEADTTSLRYLRKQIRKKTILSIVTALLLAMTIVLGICVCGIVPVWMTAEDAILGVKELGNGRIQVELSENTWRCNYIDNSFCYDGLRVTWFVDLIRGQQIERDGKYELFNLVEGESLWYTGRYTTGEDTLLWGDGAQPADYVGPGMLPISPDKTASHIFFCVLSCGVLFVLVGVILRKKLIGRLCLIAAALLLCCVASWLFVTDGYLLTQPGLSINVRSQIDQQQYIAIAVMTVISFCTVLSSYFTVKAYRQK